jgi:hypothetical protein
VGTPAFAVVVRGRYPPFAVIVIVCTPSTMLTFSVEAVLDPPREKTATAPITTMDHMNAVFEEIFIR